MHKKITFLLFLSSCFAFSQNTGGLSGRILDIKSQQPLEGATLILEGTNLGTVTDANGFFSINDIPSKSYNVVASYLGYETATQYNIIVKSVGNIP